jgi:hypothetical protein
MLPSWPLLTWIVAGMDIRRKRLRVDGCRWITGIVGTVGGNPWKVIVFEFLLRGESAVVRHREEQEKMAPSDENHSVKTKAIDANKQIQKISRLATLTLKKRCEKL